MMPIEVPQHEHREITNLAMAVERLAESQKELTDDMKAVAKSMGQMELILERISTVKSQTDESILRVHKRIDDVAADVAKIQTSCDGAGCKALQLSVANHAVEDTKQSGELKQVLVAIDEAKRHRDRLVWAVTAILIAAIAELILK